MGFSDLGSEVVARKNRKKFLSRLGIHTDKLVRIHQVHGIKVVKISRKQGSRGIFRGDALVTNQTNLFLSVLSADCFPVFFYDSKLSAIGIAHAGWRGTMRGVISKTVGVMRKHFGIKLKELCVVIGPGIRKCHFEVWPMVRHKGIAPYLKIYRQYVSVRKGHIFVDIEGIIRSQFIKLGIMPKNIRIVKECTYHLSRKYFSYRRDANPEHPRGYGNMISIIGTKYAKQRN